MKKLAKYAGITACVGLFIFLMLPFLEPPTLNDGKTATEKSGQLIPQIFTSNPLTDIVKRIARFFGKDDTPSQQAQRPANRAKSVTPHTRYAANSPEEEQELLAAAAGGAAVIPADPNAADPTSYQVQDENGEWVLVQQRAPEAAQAGMHEISVKEDAYERYVKQERTARFTPAVAMPQTVAVPDSKLARLFQPIKRFFGFGEETPTAVASGALGSTIEQDTTLAAATTGRSERLGTNNDKTPIFQRPKALEADIDPQQFRAIRGNINDSENSVTLSDLLDFSEDIESTARLVSDSLPSTGDPKKDAKARQEFFQKKNEEFWQKITNRKLADQQKLSGGTQAKDDIGKTGGCDPRQGLLKNRESTSNSCAVDSLDLISSLKEKNKEAFRKELEQQNIANGLLLGKEQRLTPILGVADISSIEEIRNTTDERLRNKTLQEITQGIKEKAIPYDDDVMQKSTQEMYQYMLESGNCTGSSCLWVANTVPQDDVIALTVSNTVEAAGFTFVGDPLHRFEQLKANFVSDKLRKYDEQNPEAPKEERSKYEKALNRAMPSYVVYNKQAKDELAKQVEFRRPNSSQGGQDRLKTSLYFSDAAEALDFTQTYGGRVPAFYGSTGHKVLQPLVPQVTGGAAQTAQTPASVSSQEDGTSLTERSEQLRNDVVQNLTVMHDVMTEIKQQAHQEAVQNTIPPKVQQTMRDIQDKIKKGVTQDITREPTVQ